MSFTGSLEIGWIIGEFAGWNFKKCVLELGGNDAFVITKNSDMKKALEDLFTAKKLNLG